MGRPLRYPSSVAYLPGRLARMDSYASQDTTVSCDERPFRHNENPLSILDKSWTVLYFPRRTIIHVLIIRLEESGLLLLRLEAMRTDASFGRVEMPRQV